MFSVWKAEYLCYPSNLISGWASPFVFPKQAESRFALSRKNKLSLGTWMNGGLLALENLGGLPFLVKNFICESPHTPD